MSVISPPLISVDMGRIHLFSSEDSLCSSYEVPDLRRLAIYDAQGKSLRPILSDVNVGWMRLPTVEVHLDIEDGDILSRLELRVEIVRFFITFPHLGWAVEEVFALTLTELIAELLHKVGLDNMEDV